jgi:hypothetical protein
MVIQLLSDKFNNMSLLDIKSNELFEFLEILKSLRLESYSSAIAPFNKGAANNLFEGKSQEKDDLDKLANQLNSKDLRNMESFSNNLKRVMDVLSVIDVDKLKKENDNE